MRQYLHLSNTKKYKYIILTKNKMLHQSVYKYISNIKIHPSKFFF